MDKLKKTEDFKHEFKMDDKFNDKLFEQGFGGTFSYTGRARLGIRAQDTEDGRGVKVLSVDEGSAADKAGIRENDIITQFEGNDVNSADELARAARAIKTGDDVSVRIQRDGRSQNIDIKFPKKLKTTNL